MFVSFISTFPSKNTQTNTFLLHSTIMNKIDYIKQFSTICLLDIYDKILITINLQYIEICVNMMFNKHYTSDVKK